MSKPRKSVHYPSDIRTLLPNARITHFEIEDEPDERRRYQLVRTREIATDELIKEYRDAEKRGTLDRLAWEVRNFCDDLKASEGGRLPTPKGGRPRDEHRRLLIAIKVRETIEVMIASGGKRGTVERALHRVATDFCVQYRRVREIYYDRDPAWMRELRVSLAMRGRALDPATVAKKRHKAP